MPVGVSDRRLVTLPLLALAAGCVASTARDRCSRGSAGVLAASIIDRQCCVSTSWGAALAVRAGYDLFFSRRWSLGALAQLAAYRYSSTEANVPSTSYGLLPTLALALTFDWGSGRSNDPPAAESADRLSYLATRRDD